MPEFLVNFELKQYDKEAREHKYGKVRARENERRERIVKQRQKTSLPRCRFSTLSAARGSVWGHRQVVWSPLPVPSVA